MHTWALIVSIARLTKALESISRAMLFICTKPAEWDTWLGAEWAERENYNASSLTVH